MGAIVLLVTSPPASLKGYVGRFLVEVRTNCFVGRGSSDVINDLVAVLERSAVNGALVQVDGRGESGITIRYFNDESRRIVDFDGVIFVEKT